MRRKRRIKKHTKKNISKKVKNSRKKMIVISIFLLLSLIIGIITCYYFEKKAETKLAEDRKKITSEITKHYNVYVKTNKETYLYNKQKEQIGKLNTNIEIELKEQEINYKTEYFAFNINDKDYYIQYQDVDKIEKLSEHSDRYKKYIPFNENVITNNITSFYDEKGDLVYTLNESFDFPIIIKKKDSYGIEFEDKLLYIKEEDVDKIIKNSNTNEINAKGIPILNYHFVYKNGETKCNEEICHSESQMTQHFSYIKENNFFTPTMKELEMYIDGELKLPKKSVVITFDDGTLAKNAKEYVDKYKLNATLFLITSWFSKDEFESKYLEIASHGDDLHKQGVCPGGQGGAIKCLNRDKLLADLKSSREKLDNTTYFCYPFYEYNEYSISVLKEAGYTMAFTGESHYGDNLAKVGSNKFKLPRFVVVNYTTMNTFVNYINVD